MHGNAQSVVRWFRQATNGNNVWTFVVVLNHQANGFSCFDLNLGDLQNKEPPLDNQRIQPG